MHAFRPALALVLCLLVLPCAALAAPGPALQEEPAFERATPRTIIRGTHERLTLDRDYERFSVGDGDVLSGTPIDSREILMLGKATGRTSVIVWYQDGAVEQVDFAVVPDISLLQDALKEIHPSITAQIAPDREAIVLRGLVPDTTYRSAAAAQAQNYIDAGSTRRSTTTEPTLARSEREDEGRSETQATRVTATALGGNVRVTEEVKRTGEVLNLIRVEALPLTVEELILEGIRPIAGDRVSVRRIVRGQTTDDAEDIFVLTGELPTQTHLSRVLHLATRIVLGTEAGASEIRVIADESGALADPIGGATPGLEGGSTGTGTVNFSSPGDVFGAGAQSTKGLFNRLGSNVARATLLEAGRGRILSMIEVTDQPQVRVNVELYEVNRSRLRSQRADLAILWSDFDQPGVAAGNAAQAIQGENAIPVGGNGSADIQNAFAFLENGFSNELQVSGEHLALDAFFEFLESEGIARSLSRPSLSVLSGEIAQFQVGGEVPIQTAFSPAFGGESATNQGVFTSVTFRAFGIQLSVRPLVGAGDRITLDVVPQIVQPDAQLTASIRESTGSDLSTIGFESRGLRTSAYLRDGQSMIIAGLITHDATDAASYAPGLNRIPILGRLFERWSTQDEDLELVILINPQIVREPHPDAGMWAFPSAAELLRAGVRRR